MARKISVPSVRALAEKERLAILVEELKRKDRIIEELRKENQLLLRVSLKKAEKEMENKK